MSIVLHGFGSGEVDSETTVVTWGLARDLDAGQTIEDAVIGASIENLFVIDYGMGRRRPSKAEYKRWKKIVRTMQHGSLHFEERKGKRGGVEYWADRSRVMRKVA